MAIEARNDTVIYTDEAGRQQGAPVVSLAAPGGSGPAGGSTNPLAISTPTSTATGASVQRPADTAAYAVGDLIANNTAAASVTPLVFAIARAVDKPIVGRRVRVKVNDTPWKGATVRVHLFKDQPTVAVGDNGILNSGETYQFTESNYLGYQDVVLAQQTSDGFVKGFVTVDFIAEPSTGTQNIYGLLEARTAIAAPGSAKTFHVTIEALRD